VSIKYKIGCNSEGKILAFSTDSTVDAGCANDFSGFVAGEVRDNIEGAYHIPNLLSKVAVLKSDTASNTAVRAPGLMQACALTEAAIDALAARHGMDSSEMRLLNLMTPETSTMITGASLPDNNVSAMAEQLLESSDYRARKAAVAAFNSEHKWKKRGIEFQPIRYGHTHAFTAGTSCQVNVNASDGSVTVWHTGTEIGQGLNAKVVGAVSQTLQIRADQVQIREVNTAVLPNAMITGGSVMSEAVCKAAMEACSILLERLAPVREFMTSTDGPSLDPNPMMSGGQFGALQGSGPAVQEPTWEQLCAFSSGSFMPFDLHINLSATGYYVVETRNNLDFIKAPLTPGAKTCGFKVGHGLADYMSTAVGISEVEIDCLTGAKTIIRTDLMHDTGNSLNAQIDIGQTEGAFVMGLGMVLQEETLIGLDGTNNASDTWEYKPCLNGDIPREFNVALANLGAPKNELGLPYVASSKASGEPPLLLACSALNAVRSAIRASRVERGLSAEFELQSPATVDRIQAALEINPTEFALC
jgi:xanthine dehydrogenase/oxidase